MSGVTFGLMCFIYIIRFAETDFERGWRNIQLMARSTSERLHQNLSMEHHKQRRVLEWQRENARRRGWAICLQVKNLIIRFFFFYLSRTI